MHMITLHPQKTTVAKALNITDAWQTLDWIKDLVNDTYARRDSISPSYEKRVKINALQIYGWLPKTNCRECGELTCLAFAVKVLSFEQKLENCKPLFTTKHSDLRKVMIDIALVLGHELPKPYSKT